MRLGRFLLCFAVVCAFFGTVLAEDSVDRKDPATVRVDPRPGTDPGPGQTDNSIEDIEGGPRSYGAQLRDWTVITEAERNAVDPRYRELVETILRGDADKRIMREYYFAHWRLQPFDQPIPEGWREQALQQLGDPAPASSITLGVDAPGGVPTGGAWVPVGPENIAGRTTGLDSPKGQPNTLIASIADGGVWRTTDAGASWERLSDFEPTLSGGAIKLDPTDSRIIYFGTGEGNNAIDNYGGIGVLKSVDAGLTWTASNNFSNKVRRLAIHETETSRLYAAGQSGCYVSSDAGANFSLIGGGLPSDASASDVLIRPDNPDVVFCAIWGGTGSGIWRSIDHGISWSRLSNGLPASGEGRIALAVSANNPDVMLAGMAVGNGTLYTTTDGGDNWITANGGSAHGYCGGQCWYDNAVGVDPDNPNLMYAAGVSAYKSTNGGASWASSSSGVHVDHHYVHTPAGGTVFLANDGGIYFSSNSGSNWSEWSFPNMDTTQYYGICRRADDDTWAFGGTQDNGSHRRNADGSWSNVLGGDGGMCMAGPLGSGIIIGEHQNHNMRRSSNNGSNWGSANGGIGGTDPRSWVGIMTVDPIDRNNMWTGTNRIYRSMDALATSWVSVAGPQYLSLSVTALEVAPSDSNVVYAGYQGGGLFRTTNALDATVSWTSIRDAVNMSTSSIRRIRVHPDDPDTAYAVFSGFGSERIWKTVNGGTSWVVQTGDLTNVPINDILIDADSAGTLIVATDLGVYRSDNDGVNWYGFSNGLPHAAGIMFTYNRDSGKLRLGTHGRSMWDWQPAAASPTPVPNGDSIAGAPLLLGRQADGNLLLRWDVTDCTGADYNLFYGDLNDVAALNYDGSICSIGNSGQHAFTAPVTPSGNAYFLLASDDDATVEGSHGDQRSGGSVSQRTANGIGLCGIASQVSTPTCP